MNITWLGHGSFELRLDSGETIIIDPWIDGNPSYPAGYVIERCDTILVTHGHFDHILGVPQLCEKFSPTVVANYEIAAWFSSKGIQNTIGMNKGGSVQVGAIKATMTNAIHSSSIDDNGTVIPAGEPAGFVIHLPDGRRIYFAGDTAVHSDMALVEALYQPELVFLPIGDLYTMDPLQAALACRMLRPKFVVPMHYGTFPPLTGTPEALARLISDLPLTKVQALTPGVPWTY